jgi:hypothetical protein
MAHDRYALHILMTSAFDSVPIDHRFLHYHNSLIAVTSILSYPHATYAFLTLGRSSPFTHDQINHESLDIHCCG